MNVIQLNIVQGVIIVQHSKLQNTFHLDALDFAMAVTIILLFSSVHDITACTPFIVISSGKYCNGSLAQPKSSFDFLLPSRKYSIDTPHTSSLQLFKFLQLFKYSTDTPQQG